MTNTLKKVVRSNHHLVADHAKREVVKRSANCTSSTLYTSPTAGQTVDISKPVTFSWSTDCLSPAPQYIDLYLYSAGLNNSMVQAFDSADYSKGSMSTNLYPAWWGGANTVELELSIVPHGNLPFLTTTSAGPVWNATWNSSNPPPTPPNSTNGSPSIAQRVKNIWARLSGGDIAAAVILPILTVVGIIVFFYVRQQRTKRTLKTNRFSKALDQRMSTISTDWRSVSGAGANAAIRASVAVRNSSIDNRSSIYNAAGIGAVSTSEEPVPQMDEMRRARQSLFANERGSRAISFAADTRSSYAEKENPRLPSAVRGLNARSFHQGQSAEDLTLSPTQTAGAKLLSPSEITPQRTSSETESEFQREVLQMPAMTLMRTGHNESTDDLVISGQANTIPQQRGTPSPTTGHGQFDYPVPTLPTAALNLRNPTAMNGGMPMMNQDVVHTGPAMSPDALLRAYANGGTRAMASPTPSSNNSGMRILYQNEPVTPQQSYPTSTYAASGNSLAPGDNNPFRKSMAMTRQSQAYTENSHYSGGYDEYADEAAYEDGTEHYGHGHAQ